ncbi:hypothetical protein YC2023_030249 [Brassica napus]
MEVVRGRMSQKFVWNHCVVFVDDVSVSSSHKHHPHQSNFAILNVPVLNRSGTIESIGKASPSLAGNLETRRIHRKGYCKTFKSPAGVLPKGIAAFPEVELGYDDADGEHPKPTQYSAVSRRLASRSNYDDDDATTMAYYDARKSLE